jgi:hypothetical protein
MLRFTLAKLPLPFTRPKIQQKNQSMELGQLKKNHSNYLKRLYFVSCLWQSPVFLSGFFQISDG